MTKRYHNYIIALSNDDIRVIFMVKYEIYLEIKKRIIFLYYLPNSILNIKELAKQFNVSIMPIREIMILLERDNLVYIVPNKGVYVADINLQELKDIFEVRIFLIGLSGRLASQRITAEELNNLKKLLEKMKQERDRKKLIRLDAKFHDLLNNSTKNKTLVKSLEGLRNRINRLWYFIREEEDECSSQIPKDFNNILKALERRESTKCEQILKKHILNFMKQIKESLYNENRNF